jgi:hypothetical protein
VSVRRDIRVSGKEEKKDPAQRQPLAVEQGYGVEDD